MKTEKQKMLAGEPYLATDPELFSEMSRAQQLLFELNALPGDNFKGILASLKSLLGALGEDTFIRPPFRCDYGGNITIGQRSFVNFDCVFLDCNSIVIGNEVQIAPGVHIYTATHPLNAVQRRSGLETAKPVIICDGVWLGGRAIICPGVTIGENTVIGAGSVVTKSLPANVVAVGSPARIIKSL